MGLSAQLTTCYFTGGRISARAMVFVWRVCLRLQQQQQLMMVCLLVGTWRCAARWGRANT